MTTTQPTMSYPFTEEDAEKAYTEWGANCGPNSLAFFLQIPLARVRGAIPGFEEKRYTSPTMMREGLRALGKTVTSYRSTGGEPTEETMFGLSPSLTRIQWTGPWTAPGVNPKWAYRQTHWIVSYHDESGIETVFDCNGGIRSFTSWVLKIVPLLTEGIKRADGGWLPTHVWRIDR